MRWQYHLEIGTFEEFNDLTERLDKLGDEGWEAAGITGDGDFIVLLKRAREENRPEAWDTGTLISSTQPNRDTTLDPLR
jgi:hypothetical protein